PVPAALPVDDLFRRERPEALDDLVATATEISDRVQVESAYRGGNLPVACFEDLIDLVGLPEVREDIAKGDVGETPLSPHALQNASSSLHFRLAVKGRGQQQVELKAVGGRPRLLGDLHRLVEHVAPFEVQEAGLAGNGAPRERLQSLGG